MKTRTGFVSNSSSSSFIVASKDKEPRITMTITADLYEQLGDERVTTLEELQKVIIDRYGWGEFKTLESILEAEGSWIREIYNECKQAIENGETVFFCSCSNESGESLSMALYERNEGSGIGDIEISNGRILDGDI